MKKKYLYNGEYYTEAEMTDFAKQSGVSFDSYIAALGKDVKVLDAPYEYKGNFYTQDEISAAAKKKGINDDAYLSQNGIKKKEEAYTGGAMSSAASKIGGQVGNFVGQSEKDNALSLIQSINAGITKGIEKGKQQFPNEIRATPEEEAALRDAQRRTGQADGLFTQQGAEQFNLLATDPLRAILDPEREKLQTAYNNRRLQGVRQTSDNTIARNNIDPNKTVQKKDGKLIPDVSSNPEYQVKNQEQALENVSGLVKNKFFKNGKEALEYAENQVKSGIDPTGNETIEHAITKAGEYKQKEESALNGKSIIQNAIEIQLQNDPLFKKQYETIINGTASDAEIADVARRFNIPLDKLKTQGSLPQEVVGELVHRFISDPDIKQIAEDNPEFKKDFDNFTGDKIYEVFPEYADVYIKNTLSRARELDGKNNWFANPIFDKSKYMDNLAEEVFKDRPILLKRVKDKFHNNWEHKIETTGIVDDLATGARGAMSGMWRSLKDVSGFGESYSDRIRNTLKEQYGHVETPHQNEFRKVVGEASNFMGMVLAMGATGSGLGNIGKGLGVMNPSVASKAVTLATFFDDELNHAASIYPENPTKAYLRASLSTAFFLVAGDAIPASKITGFKQNITQTLKSLETKALDKQAKMKLRDKILSVATETLQGTAKGTAEMTVMINGFKLLIDRALGLDESSINNEYSDANLLATAKSMLFGLPVPSMIHGFKGINRTRAAIYEMASNPEKYKSAILKRFGSDDHRIADIDFIADFKKYLDSMRVAENEKAKMVFNALHAKRLREQKSPDAFMKRNHEEEIRAIEQEQQDIMDGKDSDAGLTDSQKAIKTAYENGEINEMMEAQIKEALKDPAKADQFIKEIAEQATGAVAPELGNAKDGAIKFFGETLTDFAIGKSGKKGGGESVVFEYENEGEVPQKLKPLMVKDENGRITITMPKDEADALQKRIAEGLEPDMELMDGTLVKKTSTTEPVSPIPTEQAEALGEQVKARMGDQVSEGTNKEALEYAMEKVAEAPIEARKQLGDELFEKVLEATPTEKLQEGLDFLIDKNSDDPNVKELDRIISEREKKGSTPEQKSDWQKEQEAIDNDNTLSEAEKEEKKIESTAKALDDKYYEDKRIGKQKQLEIIDLIPKEQIDNPNENGFYRVSKMGDAWVSKQPNEVQEKVKKLNELFKDRQKEQIISEAYHKALKDGSNPELVKAVEELLSKEQATQEVKAEQPTVPQKESAGKEVGSGVGGDVEMTYEEKKTDIEKRRQEELSKFQGRENWGKREEINQEHDAELDKLRDNTPEGIEEKRQEHLKKSKQDHPDNWGQTTDNGDGTTSVNYTGKKFNDGMSVEATFVDMGGVGDMVDGKYVPVENPYEMIIGTDKPAIMGEDGVLKKGAVVRVGKFKDKAAADEWLKNEKEKRIESQPKRESKINAKYDAELKAVEQSLKAEDKAPVTKPEGKSDVVPPTEQQSGKDGKVAPDAELGIQQGYAKKAMTDFINSPDMGYSIHEEGGKTALGLSEAQVRSANGLKGGDRMQSHEHTNIELTKDEKKQLNKIESDKELGDIDGLEYAKQKRALAKKIFERASNELQQKANEQSGKDVVVDEGVVDNSLKDVETVAKKHFSDEAILSAKEAENNNEGVLINMPIDDFLSLNPKGDNADKRATVSKLVKEGTKFNEIPFLNFTHDGNGNAEVTGHEGRHRAMELKAQGETTIPVLLRNRAGGQGEVNINKESISDTKNFNEDLNPNAEMFPTKLRGHLEQKDVVIDFPIKQKPKEQSPTVSSEEVKGSGVVEGSVGVGGDVKIKYGGADKDLKGNPQKQWMKPTETSEQATNRLAEFVEASDYKGREQSAFIDRKGESVEVKLRNDDGKWNWYEPKSKKPFASFDNAKDAIKFIQEQPFWDNGELNKNGRNDAYFAKVKADHIKTELENGNILEDINDGKISAQDAKGIIENAGLKVPKEILEIPTQEVKDNAKPTISKEQTEPTKKLAEGVSSNSNEGVNPALKDVESTAKALEGVDVVQHLRDKTNALRDEQGNIPKDKMEKFKALRKASGAVNDGLVQIPESNYENTGRSKKFTPKQISEAYHKAKSDGSNPELVKAVESLLSKEQAQPNESTQITEDNSKKDVISLIKKIKRYATEVIANRKEIRRLSREAEQGRKDGGRRNVEAAVLLLTGGKESTKIEGREAQQQAIEEYAKQEGIWFDNLEVEPTEGTETDLGTYIDSGVENQVYIPKDNPKIVRKAMRTTDPFNKNNPNEVLYHLDTRISEHNAGIGKTVPYTVIGFGKLSNGDFVVITEQPHIQNARLATRAEIKSEMEKMGYEQDGKDSFGNDNYFITDVNPKNVLVDGNGNLHFIDTIYDILYDVNENSSETVIVPTEPTPSAAPNPALRDVESTAKALEELSYEEWEKVYNEVNTADKVIAAKQYFNAKETPEAERTDNQERLIKAVEELLAPKTQSKEQPTTAANETPQSSVEGAANPALRDVESKKADIERRRQEELESNASGIRVKLETYNTLDVSGEPVQVEITTNKDGSRVLKARVINEDGSIDPMAFTAERINNESQLSLTNEKLIEGYIGNEDNTLKKVSENLNPPDARTNKINAKYDAELEALNKQPKKETNPALRDVESEKKQIEDFGVAKEDVEATHGLLGRVFDGLKKAGLTAAKNVGEWVGIGKGTEKPYSLKIDGKDTQVKNVQPEVVNGFYSPLEKIITESKFDKLPAKQWAEKYANSEEAKWTGLKDWLAKQQGSVSKADIQQYLKDNRIQVVEVVKGSKYVPNYTIENEPPSKFGATRNDLLGALMAAESIDNPRFEQYLENKYGNGGELLKWLKENTTEKGSYLKEEDTKFGQYQLEGDKEGYKEILVTLPNRIPTYGEYQKMLGYPGNSPMLEKQYLNQYGLKQITDRSNNEFKSNHFDEKNILVHLRMNTRKDAEGKKVLFLEEVQSDWGQKGKKEGFDSEKNDYKEIADRFAKGLGFTQGSEADVKLALKRIKQKSNIWEREYAAFKEAGFSDAEINKMAADYTDGQTPSAPFVTETPSWTKLGLKVALKEAVKQGADKIAWTTGEQQNDRYDLSKSVDGLEYQPQRDGKYDVFAHKDDNNIFYEKGIDLKRIEDVFGKDIADKISKNEGTKATYDPNKFNKRLEGDGLKVGGKGMKGFYGSPTEGSLGIVGNVAKSLFKQEPKTTTIKGGKGSIDATSVDAIWVEDNGKILPENKREDYKFNDNEFVFTIDNNVAYRLYDKNDIKDAKNRDVYTIPRGNYFTQHSIDITPELKAKVEAEGQPLFKDAEAQYRIESGNNIIEAIKDFNKAKNKSRATVALTHEIMHPTVVSIIDGAKEGNEVGTKHTETIVNEFNKANPNNKVTVDELISGNDAFKDGTTSKQYRAVQEFIAEAWEKYHHEGAKGFSKAFQEVLDAITEVFRQVYKSLTGTTLTPELRKMFDELLGKENVSEVVKAPEISSKAKNKFSNLREKIKQKQSLKIVSDEAENRHANSKLTEADNPVQEPNVKALESEGENAKNAAQAENVIIKIDSIISAATDVGLRKVSDISTDEKRFQGRDKLNAEKVQEIAENWKDADQDPIHVWTDPKDGKTYVLSGHHRLAAAKQAGREKVKVIDRSKDFTEEQAIRFAKEEANANRTMETAIERANTLRQKRERGDTKDDINKFLDREGKNKNFVNNLSRLNPKGKTIEALRATEKSDDKVTQKEVEKIADWIGEARDRNKNLTDAHENELFDFLMDREGSKRITTKQDFLSKVNSLAGAMDFNANEPLNIARYKHKTEGEKLYDKEAETQKGKISDLQQRINEINDRIKNPNNPQYLNPDSKDYEEIKKNADNKLSELNTELQAESKALLDLYQQKGKFARQGTEQSSLFSTEKNETELPEDYYNDLRDIIKDLKDEHKGITLDEIKEIAKNELGEYYSEPDIEAAYKMTEPQPPKSAPSRPDKSVLTNIVNAENTPPEVKKKLTAHGLKYDPESHDEALQIARAVIDSLGIDAAVTQARARNFGGAVNTFIQTEALNALYKKEAQAKTAQEKYEAAEKFADISIALDEWERGDAGRGISALATFYKKSPLGMVLKENKSRKEEFNQWAKGKEESWDEFLERLNKTPEFSDYVSEKVQTELKEERKKERSKFFKKVDDTLDKWINDLESGNVAFSSVVPPKLIAEALKGVKAAFKVGESATKIIGDAIDYISENIGDNWDKDTFRAKIEKALNLRAEKTSVDRYADRLKKQIEELQKQIDAGKRAEKERKNKKEYSDEEKELQEELKAKKAELEALSPLKNTESYKLAELDKFREKLKGLSEAEKDEVVSKAYKKLLDNGALDHADLREIIAKATGRGNLTEKQAARLQDLNETINTAEIAKQKHLKERTEQTLKDYHKAIDMAAKAKRDLANEFDKKTDYLKVLSSSIQGNTLGLLNVAVMNPLYNITTHLALRLPIGTVQSLLGLALGKAEMNTVFGKPMQAEFFGKGGRGFREAFKGLLTGMNRADYESKEIFSSQIRPNRSLRALLGKDNREDKMRWQEKLFHTFSVFPGATAETVFRLLNFGDKPMRYSASAATAAAFAKKYGIKFNTMDWKTFMEFPREIVKEMELAKGKSLKEAEQEAEYVVRSIEKEGERSTMQQDNFFSDMLEKVFSGGKHEGAKSLAKTLTISPFVKIPSNVLWLGYNLVHPQIALAQAAAHTIRSYGYRGKGEIAESKLQMREARYWMSVTMMGAALQAVMIPLIKAGIITAANDEDDSKKKRIADLTYQPQGMFNMTKFWAYLSGKNVNDVQGGFEIPLKYFGLPGALGNSLARDYKQLTPEQKENRRLLTDNLLELFDADDFKDIENGIFSSSSSLLQGLKGGDMTYYAGNMVNLFTNLIQPAAVSEFSRAAIPYRISGKFDNLGDKIKNDLSNRSALFRKLTGKYPKGKRNIWGEIIKKDDSYANRYFGFNNVTKDNFAQFIYEDAQKWDDEDFLPPTVSNSLGGKKLTAEQLDELEENIGLARKEFIRAYTNDIALIEELGKNYSDILGRDAKKAALKYLYQKGRKLGVDMFVSKHPEFENVVSEEEKQVEELLKNFKEINLISEDEINEKIKH